MRPLSEQNFYQTLEVPPDATLQTIERAYRIARATYYPTSAATYSVFSEEENTEILRRVEGPAPIWRCCRNYANERLLGPERPPA